MGCWFGKLCARPFGNVNFRFFQAPRLNQATLPFVRLSIERAVMIGREFGGWFGTPLLGRCPPAAIRSPDEILDGHVRFEALRTRPFGDIPALVFPLGHRGGLYSMGRRQYLLPRLLLLCGHPERAWEHTPDCWRDSVQAIESFLGVERSSALEVWAAGKAMADHEKGLVRARRLVRRASHERQTEHEILRMIRTRLRARAEGQPFEMADVIELVGYK